jgi:hypothetical protein
MHCVVPGSTQHTQHRTQQVCHHSLPTRVSEPLRGGCRALMPMPGRRAAARPPGRSASHCGLNRSGLPVRRVATRLCRPAARGGVCVRQGSTRPGGGGGGRNGGCQGLCRHVCGKQAAGQQGNGGEHTASGCMHVSWGLVAHELRDTARKQARQLSSKKHRVQETKHLLLLHRLLPTPPHPPWLLRMKASMTAPKRWFHSSMTP